MAWRGLMHHTAATRSRWPWLYCCAERPQSTGASRTRPDQAGPGRTVPNNPRAHAGPYGFSHELLHPRQMGFNLQWSGFTPTPRFYLLECTRGINDCYWAWRNRTLYYPEGPAPRACRAEDRQPAERSCTTVRPALARQGARVGGDIARRAPTRTFSGEK